MHTCWLHTEHTVVAALVYRQTSNVTSHTGLNQRTRTHRIHKCCKHELVHIRAQSECSSTTGQALRLRGLSIVWGQKAFGGELLAEVRVPQGR